MSGIGDLVVRLGLNARPFNSGLNQSRANLSGFAATAKKSVGGIGRTIAKLGALAAAYVGVRAAVRSVTGAMEDIDRIAKLSRTIGITTGELVGLEHAAELSGVATKSLTRAVGKLTEKGLDIGGVADEIAAMESPTERMQKAVGLFGDRLALEMIPLLSEGGDAIRGMMEEGERFGGFDMLDAAQVELANDAITKMKGAFAGVARSVAITLAPTIQSVAGGIAEFGAKAKGVFDSVQPLVTQLFRTWKAFAANVHPLGVAFKLIGSIGGEAFTTIKDFATDAFILLEFGFNNIPRLAELAWEKTKLGAVSLFHDIGFFFTDQLPEMFAWFGRNWKDVFFTAFDLASTVFINLGKSIRNMFSELWKWISSGFTSGIDWNSMFVPLTEGFVNSIKEVPNIPERAATEWEKSMQKNVSRLQSDLGADLGDFMAQRHAEFEAMGKSAADAVRKPLEDMSVDMSKADLKFAGADRRGTQSAISAIAKQSAGNDPNKSTAKNTADTVKELKGVSDKLGTLVQIGERNSGQLKLAQI